MRCWTVIGILFCWCCFLDLTCAQDFDDKVNLQESRKAGHQVYSFPPPASNQEYLFYQANDSDSKIAFRLFKISERGIITTTTPIDYEIGRNNYYDLIAIRRNRGDKEGGIPTSIRITITDTNNYSPTFPLNVYHGRIKENSPRDVVVQGLENCFAEDRDTGGIASYSISGGNDKGYFKAETRKVGNRQFLVLKTTNVKIVKDTAPDISLTVRANDGLRYGTTKVVVEIVDDNNNKPIFEKDSYSATTSEDAPLLTSVLRVRATDLDSGTNGGIYYYISGSSPYFSVDAITGVIKVVRQLGNLVRQTFSVVARDRGAQSTPVSVPVTINITDIPNYPPPDTASPGINTPPTFPEKSYSANVREDFPVGAALLVIHAVDRDPPGRNRRLTYSLGGGNTFRIDTNSGVVVLNNALNYEGSNQVYRLTVTATDEGATPQRATADLIVTVQDVDENRNAPKFQIGVEQQVSSVRENSQAQTQISPRSPAASDSDQGQDGQVVYSIASGSGLPYFKIDENSGVVTTTTPLDRELQDQYDLMIQARDKAVYPMYFHLYLMITVNDMDDNFPDFSQPIYYANVPEKAPADTFVTLIHATDRDGQVVQYSINNGLNFFDIQSTTGLITTVRPLDPTRGEKSFLLSVAAASGNLQSEAQVIVTVVSKSDSPPAFKKSLYKTTVPENLGPIDNLLCLAAVDVHGKAVEYSMPTTTDGNFRVDKNSGRFSAADSFDYEVVAGGKYTVTVQASSGPSQTAFTTVVVDVEDERDPPKFSHSKFKFVIGEMTPAGTSIIVTDAGGGSAGLVIIDEDTDKSQFDCSLESIQSLDVLNYFKVKNVNGECILVTQSTFDHFDTPLFTFDVRATDKNYRNMFASAKVEVVIQDTNNNQPEFSQKSYWASVSSNFPVENSIIKISATDKDSGSFGEITYQLLDSQDRNRFSLDSNTGVLSSALSLAPKKYQLRVQASDLAQTESERKKSTVDVFVSVYSAGTTVIEFDPKSYTRTLPENSRQNTQVFTVSAKGPTGISYSIVGGNVDNAFKIESRTGRVTTQGSLNREVLATYKLVVRAETSSPSLAAEVITTIKLSDQNDERPRITFIEDPKEIAIEDYSQTGAFVIKVFAVDRDVGNAGKVQYSILTSGSPFQIDKDSGIITAGREIRRTEKQQWDIQVQATDGGGQKSAPSTLKIHVTQGSEAPQIQDRFDITLDENKDVGSAVKDISTSRDNSYKYSILSGNTNEAFCIDNTGLISVAKALDREKVSSYTMKVSVSVGNKVKNTTVMVSLRDKNDDAPQFTKSLYTFEVSENGADRKQIGTVSATDRDSGPNGDVSYRLLYTVDANSKFAVDSRTGSISTTEKLDYESIQQHVLYVRAQDAGSPQLNTITKVVVNVKDENDEDPRFSAASYVAKVALDTKIDSQVLLVTATDLDSGDNGKVVYNITKGNDEGAFMIVQDTGVIKLRKSLTTVSADQFSLTVVAKDKGTPPRSGESTVQLNVFLPDGPPKFVVKPVVEEVTEGVQANNRVLVVKAATSEALTYEIVSGNADGLFRIVASTGEILVTRELDYEEASLHQLRVRVMDTRDRSDQVDVVIKVKNINDNPPKFPGDVNGFVERKVEDDFQVGDPATRLSAYDMDAGDSVSYTLSSNAEPFFSIDNNGFLIAKKPRKDMESSFQFEVTAKDSGSPPRETKAQVRLVFVSYRPDEQPVRVYVKEDKEVGSVIATVPRYFPGGTLSIIYPQGSNFTVDNSGKLRMTAPLDFEDKQFYLLTVREKEPPPENRTNYVDVEINVLDINDNKPIMTRLDFFGRVNTNSRPGASAYQLKAEDKDGGLSGVIGYNLVSRGIPFAINPLKGLVETGGVLEDKGGYNVTLFAFDYGIPRQFGDAKGIDIKTVKFPPQFSETSYKFQVFEEALPGELVGVVNASSVSGARLMFSIEQGDSEKKFRIMPSGEIRVNSLLDREERPIYNLKVRATEQIPDGYIGEVDVEITVLNANEFYPEFDPSFYSKTVREDVSPGTSVLTLSASDCDCKGCNCEGLGLLKFSLQGTSFFKVDEDSGVISVGDRPLDYETQSSHTFIAAVKDFGEKKTFTSRAFVRIVLQNINDNAPIFQFSDYSIGIAEDAEANKALAAILARDADGSKVTYTIPSGNLNVFQVNGNTGVLSLKQGAQVQSQTQYTLRVRATDDGNLFNEVRVIVNIEDSNDNRPVFKTCSPEVKVKENLKSGQRVTQVSAEDTKDRGRNREVEYKLVTETDSFFQIDNTTGIITTVTSLDRETKSSHTLIVQAEDGGHDRNEAERLLSYCVIEVQVEDRNDNYPLFVTRTYFGSVYDKAPIGTSVVTVAAADADIAPNDKVEYAFSVPDNRFVIDRSSGQISTNVNLSGKKGTVLLAVRATNEKSMEDTNNPEIPRESETKVEIIIADEQPPRFTQAVYNVDVEENIIVGASVFTIKANGKPGNDITYSLVKSNPEAEQKFQIDPGTGLITTASTLDYEQRKAYKLQFRAKELETNLYTTCFVAIGLRDVNDDTPTFKLEEYTARVPENANSNFDVIQVKADDRDTGIFGEITYSLVTSGFSEYQYFNINPTTGTLTTKQSFDREDPKHDPKYNVLVRAKDKGDDSNAPLDAKVRVSVAIVDENDQAPEFAENRYTASVQEDAAVGTSIKELTATDKDVGENAKLDYFVSSGNSLQSFRMETVYGTRNYGVLVLDSKLDFETQEKFQIQVTVTDRKHSATVPVEITVLDTNDIVPEFTSLIYKKEINEEIGFGLSVIEVRATDEDTPNVQDKLQYSIDNKGARYFTIDKDTGLIKTANGKLDRETEQVVSFFVYATDGKHTGRALVIVKLKDVNDNAPNFPQTPYVGYVEENKSPETSVMVLQAVDLDVGSNAEIVYTMEDNAGDRFKIDSKSGLVTTTQTLEKDVALNKFNISVKATDQGNPSKSGTVKATIFVTDGNDEAPKFNPTVYRANVREDALPGYLVTQVTATDADEGPNAELEFTIIAGNDPYKFYIDPRTGRIHVSGLLDFDKGKKSFNLTVMVTDRGMPPSQAESPAFVYINLVDSNDNPPEFVPAEYTALVSEDLPVGETVQLVTAVDHDTGTNALFDFAITDGDDADLFSIKPHTSNRSIGVIYTLLELDRELVPRYNLTITATDTGGLKGDAMVIVDLVDVNDNGPWFIPPYYEGTIRAGVNEDQLVTTLKAYDPDESSNGLPFTFSVVNTNRFKLQDPQESDVSAKMYSVGTFDRAIATEWIVRVKGEDSGRPLKANFTYVYVDVLDDRNIHQPFDGSLTIIVNAYNSKFKGGVIGKAYYRDNDYGGDVNKYTMPSQEFFTIDEDSGDIQAVPNIPLGEYTFNVQVEELKPRQGSNFPKTVTSKVSVLVKGISEAAVQNSVAVQILGLRKTSFLVGDYYNKLLQLLANILSSGDTGSVFIFSIQKAPARRLPVDVLFGVEIHLAVAVPSSNFLAPMDVIELLVNAKLQLENLGLVIGAIGVDECAYEFQKVGKCKNEATGSSAYTVVSGDYGPQDAPEESLTVVSVNVELKAVYSSIVPKDLNCSTGTVCLHGGTCHNAVPKGIICECGREYRGPECQSTTRTFKGNSYIWLDKLAAYERSHVSLQFMTETADGLLLFQGPLYEGANNGLPDFMALLLVDGYVQLVITLGAHPSAPLVLYMNRGDPLNNREWHTVEVIRSLKKVMLRIDKCSQSQIIEDNGRVIEDREMCEIEGEIWGSSIYLNGFGPLQIGGVENVLQEPTISYKGFDGCIRSIYDNGVMYDLKNPLKNVNTQEGCQLPNNACPDCNDRGYCEPQWVNSICVCDLGFSGPNCNSRAKASFYLPNSFSQYQVKQARRKRRELVPPPVSMANEFYTNIALQVKVSPESTDVVILLASNSLGTEFNRIDVKNRVLRYVFRLGDRMKILSIPQLNITDNKYHAVIVKREGNRASLQVDYKGKVEGTTRGVHKLLNMGGGSYFAGGLPNVTEVRIVEAFVNSGGNAILRTADGTIIASGMGQDASSYFAGAEFTGSQITVGAHGEVDVNSEFRINREYGIRSVAYHTSSGTRILRGSTGALQDGSATAGGVGGASGGYGVSRGSGGSSGDSAGTIFGRATGRSAGRLHAYGTGIAWTLAGANGADEAKEVQVIGDFGGCTAANSYNGVDLDSDPSIEVRRQNVVFGCPCDSGFCLHGGTCINAVPPFCACPPGWTGPRCETVVATPKDGGRSATQWANPAVIACILVILLAILFIVGAVLLKRRREPVVVAVVEDGHVHDNVRPYHDEGAGEEDNFGYDITQLMKYTYVENGGLVGTGDVGGVGGGKFKKGPGAGEEEFTVAEDKPLLQGAMPGIGMQHGVTTITKRRVVHPESIDVKQFIDTRVHEADGEYVLSIDELHIYRYEGDDSDVDDLSELGDSDEEGDDEHKEQEFEFLQAWGKKFDNLNRIFNEED